VTSSDLESPTPFDPLIDMWQSAVDAANTTPTPPSTRAQLENNLGLAILNRFDALGRADDLDRATALFAQAAKEATEPGPRADYQTNLGTALQKRFERDDDLADLDRAVSLHAQAVAAAEPNQDGLADFLGNLANALVDRARATESVDDLARSLACHERAVEVAGDGATVNQLISFASALHTHYVVSGDARALERSFAVSERALRREPTSVTAVRSVATSVWYRYEHTADLADLDRAARLFARALAAEGSNSTSLPETLSDFALGLLTRHSRSRDVVDLNLAIVALKLARVWPGGGARDQTRILTNLGTALNRRRDDEGVLLDLDAAVDVFEEVLAALPAQSSDRPAALLNLAIGLRDRYERDRNTADLERALGVVRESIADTGEDSPFLPSRLTALAQLLRLRVDSGADDADLVTATEAYRAACEHGRATAAALGLNAALEWSTWAAERGAWAEAAEAGSQGLLAVEQLYRAQLTRTHKMLWLRETQSLPALTAYALVEGGNPAGAALALERSRALLLSEALERDQADLQRLTDEGRADLVERYRQAVDELEGLERAALVAEEPLPPGVVPMPTSGRSAELGRARAGLDAVIDEIRGVADYERFLDPPGFEDVLAGAAEAPLVYLAAADAGGFGLIVTGGEVSVCWLPELGAEVLRGRVEGYLDAYGRRGADPSVWMEALDGITGWLWGVLVGPLLEALEPVERATLVPAGLLGLVPLHAAWREEPGAPSGRRYALDEVLLTYAPNARALTAAEALAREVGVDGLLAVEDPRPVTARPLPGAAAEVEAARSHFSRSCRLESGRATREEVLAALDEYPLVHFACHGFADVASPLESALLMANDEHLTLRDLLTEVSTNARLAVLSACETAVPGAELPDEVVNLPTGLLQAGTAGIVGSLWSVPDASTTALTARFYELWQEEGLEPAEALRRAQQWVRDASNGEKRDRLPDLEELAGSQVPDRAKGIWERAHAHSHPYYWAAFSYIGA
jgi:tetratricopeptide (TPR) repeat protein